MAGQSHPKGNTVAGLYTIVDWEPFRSMEMHRMSADNFVVYYAIDDKSHTVTVIRIFYGDRGAEGIINAEHY